MHSVVIYILHTVPTFWKWSCTSWLCNWYSMCNFNKLVWRFIWKWIICQKVCVQPVSLLLLWVKWFRGICHNTSRPGSLNTNKRSCIDSFISSSHISWNQFNLYSALKQPKLVKVLYKANQFTTKIKQNRVKMIQNTGKLD